jgi:hypothetical protein
MAWRPYENLIDGELDNRVAGKVVGWMRFFRRGKSPFKVTFDLEGDFHDDIRGKVIRFHNPEPSERDATLRRRETYMDGFARTQVGTVGDITAGLPLGPWTEELAERLKAELEIVWRENGISDEELAERRSEVERDYRQRIARGELYYAYVDYPYIEWYSENGRVVLELEPSQLEVIGSTSCVEKTPEEFVADRKKRATAFNTFLADMTQALSKPRPGGDEGTSDSSDG